MAGVVLLFVLVAGGSHADPTKLVEQQRNTSNVNSSKLVCHHLSPEVTDGWCTDNCNCNPPFCPSNLCRCGSGPSPSPAPTPTPVTTYTCQSNKCVPKAGGVSKSLCDANCGASPTPAPGPAPGPSPVGYTRYVTYVDSLGAWWPATTIAAGTGVPGYAQTTKYNVFNVAFWTRHSPLDATTLWDSPLSFMGTDTPFGTTDDAVRKTWIDAFHDAGAKVLVSAFGATNKPCSEGENAQQTCTQLAVWAKENGFDGVDIDFEDTGSFNYNGDGEAWLIECTRSVRNVLPLGEYIVTHAPQAPYFDGLYPHGAYLGVNKEVGHLIDWYNIQFYNQGNDAYSTYTTLFKQSGAWAQQTSVDELVKKGVPRSKIVVGKPTSPKETDNTGFVTASVLGDIFAEAERKGDGVRGIMTWQYADDLAGSFVGTATKKFPHIYKD